jgi:hypothetical protein
MRNRLFCGDNLHLLRHYTDESIHLVYRDPPFRRVTFLCPFVGLTDHNAACQLPPRPRSSLVRMQRVRFLRVVLWETINRSRS